MNKASGGSDTPQRNWNYLPDLLRAMPVTVSVKDGKISNLLKICCAFFLFSDAVSNFKSGLMVSFACF